MQFYERTDKGIAWRRNTFLAFICLVRDYIVFYLPVRKLSSFLVKMLYGVNPKFVFFIHARRLEDIYVALPFLVFVRRILGRKRFIQILHFFPPFVLDIVRTKQGINGVVVTSIFLSEILLKDRRRSLRESIRGLFFGTKIASNGVVFGLGGLWPMVTRRGFALIPYAELRKAVITNGHCGTLVSLFLTIKKLASLVDIPFGELKVTILGVGKMGINLAYALYGRINTLILVDTNNSRLDIVEKELKKITSVANLIKYKNNREEDLKNVFNASHIAICTTSNLRRILRPESIPDNTIIIDDSRPEGIPRNINKETVVVLEGGLMKIEGIQQSYNFGFGREGNIFGCLGESFLLAADGMRNISPTIGKVNPDNFIRMISACNRFGVKIGDFKCREKTVSIDKIKLILENKKSYILNRHSAG